MSGRGRARIFAILWLGAGLALSAGAQEKVTRAPDVHNARYGDHDRHLLDLWRAPSNEPTPLVVYIHGGGFRSGDKGNLPARLLDLCLRSGISVASINYRLSQHAAYPAPMHDGARAIQYLRLRAKEWNLDPTAIAATGGSAGGGISLWVAFHDDLQNPSSEHPLLRKSSRLACAAGLGAQSSYDPHEMARVIGKFLWDHPGLEPFYGIPRARWSTPQARRVFADASPITHLTVDDPPVFLAYDQPNLPLGQRMPLLQGAHHPRFGTYLRERARSLGVNVTVRMKEDYRGEAVPRMLAEMVNFFREHLR